MKELELLAPAGNLEIYKACVSAGADAIYFGGELFGARAYAKNFSLSEAKEAISYGKLFGVSSYLTVNTLLKNIEIEKQLYDYIKAYYEMGIDAVIVQDFGVIQMLKACFPDLAIHASTQMTIANAKGAEFLYRQGVKRVVTAREMSLVEIAKIHATCPALEIETFCHGALCVCYSGRCLMSSLLGGRSGNRGRCAQPCRLPYQLYDGNRHISVPGEYLLSPKDLCGLSDIAALATSGVYSFKVEGRMKQKDYAAGVVSLYRKYIDAYLEGSDTTVTKEDQKKIYDLGNRFGFTNAYYTKQNERDMMTYQAPNHTKSEDVISISEKKLPVRATFIAHQQSPLELRLKSNGTSVHLYGDVVDEARKQPISKEDIHKQLNKTNNTPVEIVSITFDVDENIFIPVSKINAIRREAIDLLMQKICDQNGTGQRDCLPLEPIMTSLNQGNPHPKIYIYCKNIKQARVIEGLTDPIYLVLPIEEYISHPDFVTKHSLLLSFPQVLRQRGIDYLNQHSDVWNSSKISGIIAHSVDALAYLDEMEYPKENIIVSYYTYSNRALLYFRDLGYVRFMAPEELNEKELSHRDNHDSIVKTYGRTQLMVTANCQRNNSMGCNKTPGFLTLVDRKGEKLPVYSNCIYCYNEIYNAKTLCLFDEMSEITHLGFQGISLEFTTESAKEVSAVLAAYKSGSLVKDFTKGHFKRGVE